MDACLSHTIVHPFLRVSCSTSDRRMYSLRICSILLVLRQSMSAPIPSETPDVPRCHQSINFVEIKALLVDGKCASAMESRSKRADDTAATNNIYALQSTVNDHRTMLNDHRTMIDDHHRMMHYLINNTINVTQFYEYYAEQHSNIKPIWKSWRDITLVAVLLVGLGALLYAVVVWWQPLNLLTTILLRRHEKKVAVHPKKPIATVGQDFLRYERESNASV